MKVTPLNFETYLSVIKGSVGSNAYRHLWAEVDGVKKDIVRDGNLSCAFFVSSILKAYGHIKDFHARTEGTIRDMESCGWEKIAVPRPGAVLVWESRPGRDPGSEYPHIGFYIGDDQAVSNDSNGIGVPAVHHWTYGESDGVPSRKVLAVYWKPDMDRQ